MDIAPIALPLLQGQEGPTLPPASVPPGGATPAPAATAGTATTATPADLPAGQNAPSNPLPQTLLLLGVLFLFMWLFVLRPERKRQRQRQELLGSIQKGDQVVTSGGMYGQIVRVEEKTVTLKVDDNLRLKFDRSAIARITSSRGKEKEQAS